MGAKAKTRHRNQGRLVPHPAHEVIPSPQPETRMLRVKLAAFLFFVAVIARLSFLGHPSQVVFDEVHFGKFVTSYASTGSRFFDIHPPHAKLLVAAAVRLFGYDGKQKFENIGEKYGSTSPWAFRIVPALVGSAIPLVFFLFLLQTGASVAAAFLGGLAIALDNGFLIQARVISLDGLLVLSQLGAVCLALAARNRKGMKRVQYFTLSGLCCGLAVGSKFTGLTAPVLVTLIIGYEIWRDRSFKNVVQLLHCFGHVVFFAAAIYLLGWKIHFLLLDKPGSGDAFYTLSGHFFKDLKIAHESMLSKNYGLTASHPNASRWWAWPFMITPIFYWIGKGSSIYFLGNPAVWWGAGLVTIFLLLATVLMPVTSLRVESPGYHPANLWLPFAGYAIAFGPLIPVPRALFLYHYMTPLIFSLALSLLWLDQVGWTLARNSLHGQRRSYYGALIAVVVGYLWISPVTYAIPMPAWYWNLMPWTLYH